MTNSIVAEPARKFLFWLRFDGSRFASMAKGGDPFKGPTLINTFEACLAQMFGRGQSDRIRTFLTSRTDAGVHAIRCPVLIKLPDECLGFNQSDNTRQKFLGHFNDQLRLSNLGDALELLHIDPVATGFHPAYHVAYRRYVYRLRVPPPADFAVGGHLVPYRACLTPPPAVCRWPTLADVAEFNYSWTLSPEFNIERAQKACEMLSRPGLNFASFYMHPKRERYKQRERKSTTRRRQMALLRITKGESYCFPEDTAQFYNLEFIAHGFLRQQIRRMVAVIVRTGCRHSMQESMRLINFLLHDPDPNKFHEAKLIAAPPSGLFLADVVYDPRMFMNPVPAYTTEWDEPDEGVLVQQLDEENDVVGELDDEQDDQDTDKEEQEEEDGRVRIPQQMAA